MVGKRAKEIHVEHWVQAKERRNVELKCIIPHGLGDSVWSITEWAKLPVGSCKAFFASATKLCRPLETYAAPDVDHGIVCTCH